MPWTSRPCSSHSCACCWTSSALRCPRWTAHRRIQSAQSFGPSSGTITDPSVSHWSSRSSRGIAALPSAVCMSTAKSGICATHPLRVRCFIDSARSSASRNLGDRASVRITEASRTNGGGAFDSRWWCSHAIRPATTRGRACGFAGPTSSAAKTSRSLHVFHWNRCDNWPAQYAASSSRPRRRVLIRAETAWSYGVPSGQSRISLSATGAT